jgi:hypothetical protein
MDRGLKHEHLATGQENLENTQRIDSKEVLLEVASSLETSLDILPLGEELIERISKARQKGELKRGAAEAELLALRLEMEYTVRLLEAGELDLNTVAKMIAKMKANLDETLQERRFETILWSLDGLEDRLKRFPHDE